MAATDIDLSKADTSNVTKMDNMFYYCDRLKSLDISSFNNSKVTDMSYMFYGCYNLTELDLSSFNTSNVENMNNMFSKCVNLQSLDLNSFITSKVTNMSFMFNECNSLRNIKLSNFNTANVEDMSYMFYNCSNLSSLDLSSFNTSKVANMSSMFTNCKQIEYIDLSYFDTNNVSNINYMFSYCTSLKTIFVLHNWAFSKINGTSYIFSGCSSIIGGNGTTFDSKHCTLDYAVIDKESSPGYFTESDKKNINSITTTANKVTSTTTTKKTTTSTKKISTTTTTTLPPISIGKTEITMKNGDQYTIPANRSDLTYKSNNNDIAIVSPKGVITAVGTGNAIISVIDSEWNVVQINVNVTSSAKQGLSGDANMDNTVDLSDAVLIMQSLANPNKYGLNGTDKSHLTEQGATNADVEGRNGVTANDALAIQKYLLKLITSLPL